MSSAWGMTTYLHSLFTGITTNTWEDLEDEDGTLGTSVGGEDESISKDKSNRKERAVRTPRLEDTTLGFL